MRKPALIAIIASGLGIGVLTPPASCLALAEGANCVDLTTVSCCPAIYSWL